MDADKAVLNTAKGMNTEALIKIFDLHADPLYRYAIYSGKDQVTADQIVGEVFSKFLDEISAGKGPTADIRSFLFECAYHLLADDVRNKKHLATIKDVELPLRKSNSTNTKEDDPALLGMLSQAIIDCLTDYERHVIILHYLEGFSLEETARIFGKSVDMVRTAQNCAVENLGKAIHGKIARK